MELGAQLGIGKKGVYVPDMCVWTKWNVNCWCFGGGLFVGGLVGGGWGRNEGRSMYFREGHTACENYRLEIDHSKTYAHI